MCTGRVDLAFVLRAFAKGADGVFIGGCWPGECHYVTEGNYDALANMYLCRKLLGHIGVDPQRLRLEWIAASEGSRFAEVSSDFVRALGELGPLGEPEGLDDAALGRKLAAVMKVVPYLKLVERARLRLPEKSEQAYREFFTGQEFARLFDELVAGELVTSEMLSLLEQRPLSTAAIAEVLGLSPSEASRYINGSARQGRVRYDVETRCYALA